MMTRPDPSPALGNLRSFLALGTGDGVASWPLIFWITLLGVLHGLLSSYSENSISPFKLALALALSALVMFAFIMLVWFLLLRQLTGIVRIAATLATFMVAAVVRISAIIGLIAALASNIQRPISFADVGIRVLAYVVVMSIALTIGTYIVGLSRVNRDQVGALKLEQERVRQAVTIANESIAHDQSVRTSEVQQLLGRELVSLREPNPELAIPEAERIIAKVVRPLSRQLAQEIPAVAVPQIDADRYRVSWRSLWAEERVDLHIEPLITSVVFAIYIYSSTLQIFGTHEYRDILIACPFFLLGLVVAKAVAGKLFTYVHWFARLVLLVALVVVTQAPAAYVFYRLNEPSESFGIGFVYLVTGVTMSLLIAVASTLRASVNDATHELSEVQDRLEWVLARAHMVQWFESGQTARIVHGPVQSELIAYLRELHKYAEGSDAPLDELANGREGVKQDWERRSQKLSDSLASIFDPARASAPSAAFGFARLEATQALWRGVAEIRVEIDEASLQELSSDPIASDILLGIVEESIGNAVKHGNATEVDLEVRLVGQQAVSVELADNGRAEQSVQNEGVGSRQLNDCAIEWSRVFASTGTTLKAKFPIEVCG